MLNDLYSVVENSNNNRWLHVKMNLIKVGATTNN